MHNESYMYMQGPDLCDCCLLICSMVSSELQQYAHIPPPALTMSRVWTPDS